MVNNSKCIFIDYKQNTGYDRSCHANRIISCKHSPAEAEEKKLHSSVIQGFVVGWGGSFENKEAFASSV